jgi:hypothetical protein
MPPLAVFHKTSGARLSSAPKKRGKPLVASRSYEFRPPVLEKLPRPLILCDATINLCIAT